MRHVRLTGLGTTALTMFAGDTAFNRGIGSWNTSSVTGGGMGSMFKCASSFNQPLNSWDVSHVTNMAYMLNNATVFNQDLSG